MPIMYAALALFLILPSAVNAEQIRALSCGESVATSAIDIALTSEIRGTVPSAHIYVAYAITNKSATAVTDATLIFDVAPANTTGQSVQRFVAVRDVNLAASVVLRGGAVWNVPPNIPSGEYVIIATLIPKKLSLPAALYESTLAHASLSMHITGGVQSAAFVKDSLRVADTLYDAQNIIAIPNKIGIPVSIQIVNLDTGPYIGTLTWRLYPYDAPEGSSPTTETKDPVTLHPSANAIFTHNLSASVDGVYMLEAELSDGVSSSFQRFWLAQEGSAPTNCAHPVTSPMSRTLYHVALGIVALLASGVLWRFFIARRTEQGA